jgi:transglutaminase-like putative cysteine protease
VQAVRARPILTTCRSRLFLAALLCLFGFAAAAATSIEPTTVLDRVRALVESGHFAEANSLIDAAAKAGDPAASGDGALAFERDRMHRILLDFSMDAAQVEARVRKQIPDLKPEEFARWDAAGLFERRPIDGQMRYFNPSGSNLFRLSKEALARRREQTPLVDGPMESSNPHHREVRDAALASGKRFGAPRRIRVTQSLTVNADAVPAGELVRAWIPFPRAIPGQQEDLHLLSSLPAQHQVAPEAALQRTVYMEQPAAAHQPTKFSITYELTIQGQYTAVDPARVTALADPAALEEFLGERAPHIVFTPAMHEFSRRIVGSETNPARIAQKLFDAVDRIPWAGALEYSTIANISDYALHAGHADCGQQTLLLITLLRLNGIPARWQSGMVYSEGEYWNLHDWGWLYLEPYGWLPMDVTFGRLQDPDPQIAGFYLGGLDAYRIAFNDDYGREFVPAKQHFRSETVDLQRGEVEWSGGNLYFDQWDYDFVASPQP